MVPFENGFETIRLIAIREPTDFKKAVREVEIKYGIPEHLSSIKESLCLQ